MIASLLLLAAETAPMVDAGTIGGLVTGGGGVGSLVAAYLLFERMGWIKKRGEDRGAEAATAPSAPERNTALYRKRFSEEQRHEKLDTFLKDTERVDWELLSDQVDDIHGRLVERASKD